MATTAVRALTYAQAVNEGFHQEFERDPSVIIMGEDVAGGAGAGRLRGRVGRCL